jgi:hypothetical protein
MSGNITSARRFVHGILFYSTVLPAGALDVRIPQKHHPKEFNAQIAETNSLSGAKYYRLRY